jgi:hypothetical protein
MAEKRSTGYQEWTTARSAEIAELSNESLHWMVRTEENSNTADSLIGVVHATRPTANVLVPGSFQGHVNEGEMKASFKIGESYAVAQLSEQTCLQHN